MNGEKKYGFGWLVGPALFVVGVAALLVTWKMLEPSHLVRLFDQDGRSPFELATLPFYAAIIPLVWWKCPFDGSRTRRNVLCLMVSVVAVMAVVKELDLHNAALHVLYPGFVGENGSLLPDLLFKPNGKELTGTPFKMRVITNSGVPLGMKALVVFYFAAFFGVFAAGFLYLLKTWVLGVFSLEPCAWSIGCFGASGVMVQVADRLPSWLGHAHGLEKSADGATTAAQSLCTALEEGGELLIALFAILAIVQAHRALVSSSAGEARE